MLKLICSGAISVALSTGLYAQNGLNSTVEKTQVKKYEEINKEEHTALMEFDEWLIVIDKKEEFVKAYNISHNHTLVQKLKCMYELNTLFNGEMEFDDLEAKCSR